MTERPSDEQARQTLLSAGMAMRNANTAVSLKAAITQTGIPRTIAYRIFGDSNRGLEQEFQHQVAQAMAPDAEVATEHELTGYLASVIQHTATELEAWRHTDSGQAYLTALSATCANRRIDTAFGRVVNAMVDATTGLLSDALASFGLIPAPHTTIDKLSADLVAIINDHLVDPHETVEVSTLDHTWSPLGHALARHIASNTEPDPHARQTAQPANLTPRQREMPQPTTQLAFTGQLNYVLSGLIGEHLTIHTTAGEEVDLRLTGWEQEPYTLIGGSGSDDRELLVEDVAVAHIHPGP